MNLKEWRSSLGISQEKAANLLGVHRVTYTRWETGAKPVPKLVKIACKSYLNLLKPII